MNGPELVNAYNALAATMGKPAVKRFSSLADGQKRLELLQQLAKKTITSVDAGGGDKTVEAKVKRKADGSIKVVSIKERQPTAIVHGNRARAIDYLKVAKKPIAVGDMAVLLYQVNEKGTRGRTKLVLMGVNDVAHKLGYKLVKTGKGAELSYELAKAD